MFLPTNITLKFGDSGDFVTELQRRLTVVQCFSEGMINGFFDGNTANGVSRFQGMVGIHADGIAGPETLRRLNGAISGDFASGGGNTNQAEEEERKRREAEALRQQQIIFEQQRLAELEQQRLAEQQQIQLTAQQQAAYAPQPQPAPPGYDPPQPVPQQAPPQPMPPQYQPPPTGPSAAELLAKMLTSNQPPQQVPAQAYAPQPQPTTPQQSPAPPPQPQAYAPPQQAQPYEPPAPLAPEQPKGLVGRAMQYANEVVQKLATYFESKLPRHVIEEVKQIGHAMASSGVKEVPIPMGPEQQRDRGIEPQRGAQQGRQVG